MRPHSVWITFDGTQGHDAWVWHCAGCGLSYTMNYPWFNIAPNDRNYLYGEIAHFFRNMTCTQHRMRRALV